MFKNTDFLKIAITRPDISPGEDERITDLLASGEADIVHLRHPSASACDLANVIYKIPSEYHPRLTLHDNHQLTKETKIGGIHYNSRNPLPEDQSDMPFTRSDLRRSVSCHSIEEAIRISIRHPELTYITLSPIFDSISKSGYASAFDLEKLRSRLSEIKLPVVALSGVTPDKFSILKSLGFRGAAMLGHYNL